VTADLPPLNYPLGSEALGRGRGVSSGDRAAGTSMSWRGAVVAAAGIVAERPTLVAVGLLGFLARGGLVLFALPIVALPTPTGISNFIGGTALTGAGASEGLARLIAGSVVAVLSIVVIGTIVGAATDVLLVRAAARTLADAGEGPGEGPGDAPETWRHGPVGTGLLLKISVIRLIALVPLTFAVAWAAARLVAAGYHELILPDDLTVPLAIRIIRDAVDAVAVVAVVWLADELIGGLAVREVLQRGASIPAAFRSAVLLVLRRPLTCLATLGLSVGAFIVGAVPVLLVSALLWSRLQAMLADDEPPWLVLPTTFLFVLVWGGGLLLVGVVVTWRGVLASLDVQRAARLRP
jgi:hypothetical protein